MTISRRDVWSLAEAREALIRFSGEMADWTSLDSYLSRYLRFQPGAGAGNATATASSFAAVLELVREGKLKMRQNGAYSPLYLRVSDRGADNQPNPSGKD